MMKRGWADTLHTVLTVALLLLFGVSAFILTVSAGNAYGRISEEQDISHRLRVAANYITNHIRRADAAGAISVTASPFGDCLVLGEGIDGEAYETRIYFHNGYLRESFVPAGSPYDAQTGFEVAELDGFGAAVEAGVVYATVTAGGETRTVPVTLMAGEGDDEKKTF